MNKKDQKNTYQAPQLKVVSFKVENGFAGSNGTPSQPGTMFMSNTGGDAQASGANWHQGSTEGWF